MVIWFWVNLGGSAAIAAECGGLLRFSYGLAGEANAQFFEDFVVHLA